MAKIGRPNALDNPETMAKIKQAFAIGSTDEEACAYANIGTSSLYRYQEEHQDFREEKERLKQNPILKARQELVKGLEGNPELSLKFLERKLKSEFSTRSEFTGKDGKDLLPKPILGGKSQE